jgi:hypothetical protein
VSPRDLDEWQQALQLAEAELREREQQALSGEPTPQELRALAAERDKLATDRDALADAHDERARGRDTAALGRDVDGSARDRTARMREQDLDEAFSDRFNAGVDRDLAAGDRADAFDDRHRGANARRAAAQDRQRASDDRDLAASRDEDSQREREGLELALETRFQIGQAQGVLMARHDLDPEAAFRMLVRLSQETGDELRDVAVRIVAGASQGF